MRTEWRAELKKARHRPPGVATCHPKRNHKIQRETGDRMIGWGTSLRSRVSAIWCQVRVLRFRFGCGKSALCHRSSIHSSTHSGWQVAGLSIQPSIQSSTQSSMQSSVIDSVIRHLSSIQSSTSGGRWLVSTQPSNQPNPTQLGQHAVLTLPRGSVLK